jgi:hypothetical protein
LPSWLRPVPVDSANPTREAADEHDNQDSVAPHSQYLAASAASTDSTRPQHRTRCRAWRARAQSGARRG